MNLVIDHWEKYAPILRVRNNASDEGDSDFRRVRMETMMPMVQAFADEIMRAHEAARRGVGFRSRRQRDGRRMARRPGPSDHGRDGPGVGARAAVDVPRRDRGARRNARGSRRDAATLIQAILTSRR